MKTSLWQCRGVVEGCRVVACLTAEVECRFMVGQAGAQLRGVDVVELAERIGHWYGRRRIGTGSIRADDVERVAVVTQEAEQRVGQLADDALVLFSGGQVAQVLQREQHQRVHLLGLHLAVHFLPLGSEAHRLGEEAGGRTIGALAQQTDKLAELYAGVPFFVSFCVNDSDFHCVLFY